MLNSKVIENIYN